YVYKIRNRGLICSSLASQVIKGRRSSRFNTEEIMPIFSISFEPFSGVYILTKQQHKFLSMINQGMLKDDALKGKTIIVTGGGTGLGKAMGKYFLQLGANLVITSRKLDVLEDTADELENATGGKVLAV